MESKIVKTRKSHVRLQGLKPGATCKLASYIGKVDSTCTAPPRLGEDGRGLVVGDAHTEHAPRGFELRRGTFSRACIVRGYERVEHGAALAAVLLAAARDGGAHAPPRVVRGVAVRDAFEEQVLKPRVSHHRVQAVLGTVRGAVG
jgi:hypothetical protein